MLSFLLPPTELLFCICLPSPNSFTKLNVIASRFVFQKVQIVANLSYTVFAEMSRNFLVSCLFYIVL